MSSSRRSRVTAAPATRAATGSVISPSAAIRSAVSILCRSAMVRPPMRDASAAGLSRAPPHAGQGSSRVTRRAASRTFGGSEPMSRRM
ncbi:hypothetical protein [Actinomadura madurae]|uniref:hypothetical protein n=1 Tax=Actinomadura madurae TaxID=1993 RepID=UPI0027E2483F|nr:hypothetical protein [Actinomadura madurae]